MANKMNRIKFPHVDTDNLIVHGDLTVKGNVNFYPLSGVWVFNEVLNKKDDMTEYAVNFSSNGVDYEAISDDFRGRLTYTALGGGSEQVYNSGWYDEAYRTVDFGTTPQAVSVEFYNWFTANAVCTTPDNKWQEITDYIDKEIAEFDFVKVVDKLPEEGLPNREYFVRKDSPDTNDLFDEYAWINIGTVKPIWAWEFKGTKTLEIDLSDYVKKTDYAIDNGEAGIVKAIGNTYGVRVGANGLLFIHEAGEYAISQKASAYLPITAKRVDYAVKVGITTNAIPLTDEEKAAARNWIDAEAATGYFTYLDCDEQPHEFTFKLGMTWRDFIESDYNQENMFDFDKDTPVDGNGHCIVTEDFVYAGEMHFLVSNTTYYCEEIL